MGCYKLTKAAGTDVLLDIDTQGAFQVREKNPDAVLIFIMPPSIEELRHRLVSRMTESEDQLEKRLASAEEEMSKSPKYDHVIVNDDVDRAYGEFRDIIESYRREDETRS